MRDRPCPCRGCEARAEGCRASCPRDYGYSEWAAEHAANRDAERAARQSEGEAMATADEGRRRRGRIRRREKT